MRLSLREWTVAAVIFLVACTVIQQGWYRWERFERVKDYRLPCFGERMSDYWSFVRWCRFARDQYKVSLIGDSVIWGQEVTNDQTISHHLNEQYGQEIFANMGIDGLHELRPPHVHIAPRPVDVLAATVDLERVPPFRRRAAKLRDRFKRDFDTLESRREHN